MNYSVSKKTVYFCGGESALCSQQPPDGALDGWIEKRGIESDCAVS